MIVDCGGSNVYLTTRKLVGNTPLQLSEITTRIRDLCGSTFIDKEFIKFLGGKVGTRAMDLLGDNNYEQLQFMIQQFCKEAKFPFTGDDPDFSYEMDLENIPVLRRYVSREVKEN